MPISAYTYEHLRRYMEVFAYTSNVVPNIFCIDSQKMSADAQKALGADGYWSRQIINSKPISIQSKDNCIDESEGEGGQRTDVSNKRNCGIPKEGSLMYQNFAI